MNKKILNRNDKRKEKTRQTILISAKELFYEQGYVNTPVKKIMESADLGHGTYYQYFDNKQSILNYFIDELSNSLDQYLIPEKKLPVVQDWLYYGIYGYLKFQVDNKEMITVIKEAIVSDSRFTRGWNQIHKKLTEQVTADINNSLKKGYCREQINTTVTILSVVSAMEGVSERFILNEFGTSTLEKVAEGLTDLIYHAIFKR